MKAYRKSGGMAPMILNISTGYKCGQLHSSASLHPNKRTLPCSSPYTQLDELSRRLPILFFVFQVVSFPSGLLTKALYAPLLSPIRATCPAHLILLALITRIRFHEYRLWSSSSCNFRQSPVTSSLLGPHIFLSTLSNTLSVCSPFYVRHQVSRRSIIHGMLRGAAYALKFKKSLLSYNNFV